MPINRLGACLKHVRSGDRGVTCDCIDDQSLVGHVILSQDHMLVYHMIPKLSRCHVIKHVTDHVIVSQGHMVEEWFLPCDYTLA